MVNRTSADPEGLPLVVIYTDGACDPNPGPGGWAAVLKAGRNMRELSGGERHTTNNRMELRAAIEALRALKFSCRVNLYTDSEYLQRGMTEWMPGWLERRGRKKPLNWDLWEELLEAARPHTVHWRWVQGHAGNPLNERAHRLAAASLGGAPPD